MAVNQRDGPPETEKKPLDTKLFPIPVELVNRVSNFWDPRDFFNVAGTSGTNYRRLGEPRRGQFAFQACRPHPGYEQAEWVFGNDDGCRLWRVTGEFSEKLKMTASERSATILSRLPHKEYLDGLASLEVLRRRGVIGAVYPHPINTDIAPNTYIVKLLHFHGLLSEGMDFTTSDYSVRLGLIMDKNFAPLIQTVDVRDQARLSAQKPSLLKHVAPNIRFTKSFRHALRKFLSTTKPPDENDDNKRFSPP